MNRGENSPVPSSLPYSACTPGGLPGRPRGHVRAVLDLSNQQKWENVSTFQFVLFLEVRSSRGAGRRCDPCESLVGIHMYHLDGCTVRMKEELDRR